MFKKLAVEFKLKLEKEGKKWGNSKLKFSVFQNESRRKSEREKLPDSSFSINFQMLNISPPIQLVEVL